MDQRKTSANFNRCSFNAWADWSGPHLVVGRTAVGDMQVARGGFRFWRVPATWFYAQRFRTPGIWTSRRWLVGLGALVALAAAYPENVAGAFDVAGDECGAEPEASAHPLPW